MITLLELIIIIQSWTLKFYDLLSIIHICKVTRANIAQFPHSPCNMARLQARIRWSVIHAPSAAPWLHARTRTFNSPTTIYAACTLIHRIVKYVEHAVPPEIHTTHSMPMSMGLPWLSLGPLVSGVASCGDASRIVFSMSSLYKKNTRYEYKGWRLPRRN